MKTRILWVLWALVPLGVLALHMGPGQVWKARDSARVLLTRAKQAAANEEWIEAADGYAAARAALPEDAAGERTRLSILEAKARIRGGQLLEGAEQLETLLNAERAAASPDGEVVTRLRNELGTARYYAAWLMRLEGADVDEWKPEAEAARQQFRLLAEGAVEEKLASADDDRKNLEQVIRLEQMDLSELRGLALPKNCPGNCKNLCQKKREQRLSKCKKPGEKKDARQEIKAGAESMPRGTGY